MIKHKKLKIRTIDEKIEMLIRFIGILPLGHSRITEYYKQIQDLETQKSILEKS